MPETPLRDARYGDFPQLCALNQADVQHTSAMDEARLVFLHERACYARVACNGGEVAAFLLAMRRGADYENENFAWFSARYADFLYIDRVVVAQAHRGAMVASRLYADLFDYARAQGIPRLACEINIRPPNEPSRRFHARQGFVEVGTLWLAQGSKQVSMQVAAL
jgi:uncharacterized protein